MVSADAGVASVVLTGDEIAKRVAELGATLSEHYADSRLLCVGVLRGAFVFMADLARALAIPAEFDFMAVSSYGKATKTSGVVRILKDLDQDVAGQDVLLVEDIVDSGLTLAYLLDYLRSRGPASLEVCALLRKPAAAKVDVAVRWTGFEIPNRFVVGYGLDAAGLYRNLPFVGVLDDATITKVTSGGEAAATAGKDSQ